ncbi:ftsK/SpoIIIE family protein [Mycobacterium xenopi 4042]|uniref:FtsK/SpoIIIE family protein n=1 Tax=Mycobacterium xenopi 4042 TaxID=1299334 RepID=X8CN70_MYCXE|nr:ftsK/SpoIIIE family protein [Mycobacterium xenopi 4042]
MATAQRGKSTTLMTLMTSAALMYRPERVTFFCIGASLYPVEELPTSPGGQPERHRRCFAHDCHHRGVDSSPRGVVQALSDRHFRISRTPVRGAGGGGTDPEDKFGDVFLVIDNYGDLYEKDRPWATVPSPSPGRACPTGCT